MSDEQREIGFDGNGEKFPPKKTLYDKILENREKSSVEEQPASPPPVVEETPPPLPPVEETPPSPPPVDEVPPPPPAASGEKKEKKKGKPNKTLTTILIALMVIMVGVIGFLVYTLMTEREETEEMRITLEMQKDNLTNELNELYSAYDSLQTNNDSMNVLIEERQDQIRNLLAIRASNAKKIQMYEEQVSSLREVLKSYIVQVDSLNQANLRLQAENRAAQDQIHQATRANQQLERNIKNLEETVEKASVVKALFVQAEPIEDNGNVARRLKRVDKIKVSFALAENPVADQGLKRIYIRISNPSMRTMTKSLSNVFEFNGEQMPYSAFRDVEYEGTQLDVAIYYDADESEITEGTYYVDVFMDGETIGTTSFSLK